MALKEPSIVQLGSKEFDFILYYPRDLAILAYEGNADYIGSLLIWDS
jgi:hypothetical protein